MSKPRLLIEEWLPAQAIGVECMREENNPVAKPPTTYLHIWWARRPLVVSRAAVLASLLPSDFDKTCFERLLGFYSKSDVIVKNEQKIKKARQSNNKRIQNPHGRRAFSNLLADKDVELAYQAMNALWGGVPITLDPMAGGGSIPLETARLGLPIIANEYNPVACSILEATIDYPFRFGPALTQKIKKWGKIWLERLRQRMEQYYYTEGSVPVYTYLYARTIPCPDTGHMTPLIPDWHLLKTNSNIRLVAEPIVNKDSGTWTTRIREVGKEAGQLSSPPNPTFIGGGGISLFTNKRIPDDYIKAIAQSGGMGFSLYAVATKATKKFEFRPPNSTDLKVLLQAGMELKRLRNKWESEGIIPIEKLLDGDNTNQIMNYGVTEWSEMFSPRQLLSLGTLVEELKHLRTEILSKEDDAIGEAIIHILALCLDKLADYNAISSIWHPSRGVIAHVFNRHEYAFKATFAEMAVCVPGGGFEWVLKNVTKAYDQLAKLPTVPLVDAVPIHQGSATNLAYLDNESVSAVVVDPPYAGNVHYFEMADFFYVWLKRTQGVRHPDWFSTYLCERDLGIEVNLSRHQDKNKKKKPAQLSGLAHDYYQSLMTDSFKESHRVLINNGILTIMFTHKEQIAWAALFASVIEAGFTIKATWPVKTESEFSLHQAKKNAAQSTVILVARKREQLAGLGYYDETMKADIRQAARSSADRLQKEGLNPVDQLVGAFGPAMEVFSRYGEVFTDTGERVPVAEAIQMAADAVADWRIEQLAQRSLEGVDPESRFVLLCWDVLGAAEFRFNEAMLLGRSVGMDINALIHAGLLSKKGENVLLQPARDRRREEAVKNIAGQLALFGGSGRGRKKMHRKVHPGDQYFASAIDICHALALRHAEAGGGEAGIGAAKGMALQQGWTADSPCASLMEALVHAAPEAVRFPGKGDKKTVADTFPEFRAWHAMLKPLFGIEPLEWKEAVEIQPTLPNL